MASLLLLQFKLFLVSVDFLLDILSRLLVTLVFLFTFIILFLQFLICLLFLEIRRLRCLEQLVFFLIVDLDFLGIFLLCYLFLLASSCSSKVNTYPRIYIKWLSGSHVLSFSYHPFHLIQYSGYCVFWLILLFRIASTTQHPQGSFSLPLIYKIYNKMMKNILEYLWQTDRSVQTQTADLKAKLGICNCLVVDENLKPRWYFFSIKQSKTLRKKAQNMSIQLFLKPLQEKRANGYAGLCILFNHNKIEKQIIGNEGLVDLLLKSTQPFIYVDLSWANKVSFFSVLYEYGNTTVEQVAMPEFIQILCKLKNLEQAVQCISLITLSLVKALEESLTLGKSVVKKLKITIAYQQSNGQAFISLLWGDQLSFNNDYYGLGFQYQQRNFIIKPAKIQQQIAPEEEWQCQGCLKQLTTKDGFKQVSQQDIIFIRSELGVSKYGITGKDIFQICKDCVQVLRNN